VQVKKMIHEWERQYPGRIDNMATAMGNVTLSHLMDRQPLPLHHASKPPAWPTGGDKAFDAESPAPPPRPGTVPLHLHVERRQP
jgi:tRNA 2-thiocytidine biosynthesis protein TtcA